MKFQHFRRRSGFTLIEILLTLGIISVLVIAAFVIYPKVKASLEARTEAQNLGVIEEGLRNIYQQGNYGGLMAGTPGAAINTFVFPASMFKNGHVRNVWNSGVVAGEWSTSQYYIDYIGVSTDACMKFVLQTRKDWDYIAVGPASGPAQYVKNGATNPIDLTLLATQCNLGTSSNKTTVEFIGH